MTRRLPLKTLLPSSRAQWMALLFAALALLALAVTQSSTVVHLDTAFSGDVRGGLSSSATAVIFAITQVGSTHAILTVTALAIVLLAALRHWHGTFALAVSVGLTNAVVDIAKLLFERPRPSGASTMVDASGFSFPSAHAATSVALYATLMALAAHATRGIVRFAIIAAGTILIVAVGGSRVYLGAHYATDVVAGWLTGSILVLSSWALAARLRSLRPVAPA